MSLSRRAATWLSVPLLVLVGGRASRGADAPPEPDPILKQLDARVAQFLKDVSMRDTQRAYQELLIGSRLIRQGKALEELTEKTQQLQKKYGQYCGFEQIAARRVGSDLVLLRYLYKCEDFPVVWYFAFYRASPAGEAVLETTPWRVVTVRFDTKLEQLWAEAPRRPATE